MLMAACTNLNWPSCHTKAYWICHIQWFILQLLLTLVFLFCRLYSCLANGSADEFQKGEQLFRAKAVNDALQIGKLNFHLSESVTCS